MPTPGAELARHFNRYVAIGDSSTEGLDDPAGDGSCRGWAIRDQQLAPALALHPDLVTLFSGTNDVVPAAAR